MYRYIRYFVCLLLLGGLPVSAAEVNPDIIQAIALEGKVSAIIHLQVQFDLEPTEQSRQTRSIKSTEPEIELTTAEKLERISQAIAPVQAEILAAVGHLDASQFNLTLQYSHIAALVADIGAEALAILRQHPNVLAIQVNSVGSVSLDDAKPVIKVTDNATDKNRTVTQTGAGITVAVLDSGIDTDHEHFNGVIVGQKCYVNKESKCANGTSEDDSAEDDNGHGTHVSGIIASPNGVAPGSEIMAVKIADNSGVFQLADLMAGVNWVMSGLSNNNVKIMNLSLGLSDSFNDAQACDFFHPSYTTIFGQLSNEFKVSIFAASGNDNDAEKIDWPSCLSNVIAVGNSNNSDVLHTGEGSGGNRGALLEIVAPGVNIKASKKGGGTEERTGTSMSSPMAAGVAALLLQKTPGLSPSLIKQKLISTGTDGFTDYKRIDATEALADTTTQAIMQVTHNSIPLFNDKTYDFGIFSRNDVINRNFKIYNLGNDDLIISDFNVEDVQNLV
jgi:subtilisin family serine protease